MKPRHRGIPQSIQGIIIRVMCLILLVPMQASLAANETINTATLVSSAIRAAPSCARYRPTGVCFYLKCVLFSCWIETTLKVGHYNPELVVSAYNSIASSGDAIGGNPWTEAKTLTGSLGTSAASTLLSALGGGAWSLPSGGDFSQGPHQNLLFKEADAIGHPAALLSSQFNTLACPSDTTAFKPYFISGFDVLAWRWQVPELVYSQSWLPGAREVGHFPLYTWGAIYPRSGFATQSDEVKLAALLAQRAADIVTRKNQPHVYLTLGEGQDGSKRSVNGDMMVWSPGAIKENEASTGYWQMVSPHIETSCSVFGSNDVTTANSWGAGKVSKSGSYAWTLWRPYQCCSINGAFLFSIDLASITPDDNSQSTTTNSVGLSHGSSANTGHPLLSLPAMPSVPSLSFPGS